MRGTKEGHFMCVYMNTPRKLTSELRELNPDTEPRPDEALDDPMEPLPVKKFPIN